MKHQERTVYGGVDTHQDVHVAAVIDHAGRLLGTKPFPTTPLGLRSLERWLTRHGTVAKIGVEGTGTYGLGLQRVLQAAGHEVVEVNRPNRQTRRARGKSDTIDAESAARAVLAGHATAAPKAHDGVVESIRVLLVAYGSARRNIDRIGGQLRSLVVTAPEAIRIEFAGHDAKAIAAKASRLRPGEDCADVTTATKTALRMLARQYQALTDDIGIIDAELETLTTTANPGLRQVPGVGPIVAARLLVAAGDNPERLTSDAAFAALCGASPVPASSGKTTAVRLNRGGDRHANSALHRIVIVRMSHKHPATMNYLARRTAQGMPRRSIIRCLKRYIAREIYHHLVNPRPAIQTDDLRARRTAIGQPMRVVALAAGNVVILKPSEWTPLSSLRLGELMQEAGFPPGVFQILTGDGQTVGDHLIRHPGIDKIAFTGSTRIGRHIGRIAGEGLKRVTLELGGKSANIVTQNADLTEAIPGVASAIFYNAGQNCMAGSRLLVHSSRYDEVLQGVAEYAESLKIGAGHLDDTQIGPMVSEPHMTRVMGYIDTAEREGATVVTGGARADMDGYFVTPTVIADVDDSMTVVREEIFGPVLVAQRFDSEDEAVQMANGSEYGLAGGIWSRDIAQAHRLATRMKGGSIFINSYGLADPAMPFGGMKSSGWGRENGLEALDSYLETKSVYVPIS